MAEKGMEKFREMDANELEIQEHELGEQIFRLRFQLTTGQAESVKKLREARRDLARVKTLARQQQLGLRVPEVRPEAAATRAKSPAKGQAAASNKKKPTHKRSSRTKTK